MTTMPTLEELGAQRDVTDIGRLLVTCNDRPGIVAAIARFLHAQGANIAQSDQYSTDPAGGRFFLRMEFHLPGLQHINGGLEREFDAQVAHEFAMEWRITHAARRKRVAVLVSREDHCLLDLLWRWRRDELDVDIGQVISNHPDCSGHVAQFGVPFEHVPVERGRKAEAEARQLDMLAGRFDLVILARYMQILSGEFLDRLGAPVINIHHSFLPAFAGSGPYQRAKERGVKLVGATAHYVTEELDAGPIIDQDVVRVTHRDGVGTMRRLGSDIERTVLMRAVQWHCEDRVLVHDGTTVVF
jgi:formyltetrahydrofolate deformylase